MEIPTNSNRLIMNLIGVHITGQLCPFPFGAWSLCRLHRGSGLASAAPASTSSWADCDAYLELSEKYDFF